METLTAIDVHLENFEGPLDLLMHLIKKNNLDIYDIPIAQITGEYLQYLDVMKSLNLEIAGEFLVMAATLMQIKAKMLLPAPEMEGGENGPDPRGALVSMLEEYQRYKEASKEMNGRFAKFKDAFYRGSPVFSNEDKYLDLDMFALMDAVQRAFKRVEKTGAVDADPCPIDSRIEKVQKMLEGRQWLILDEIFATETTPRGVITCFMAMLELIKLRKIVVSQDEAYTEVRIYPAPAAHAPAEQDGAAPSQEPEPEPEPAPAEEMPAPEAVASAGNAGAEDTFVEETAQAGDARPAGAPAETPEPKADEPAPGTL